MTAGWIMFFWAVGLVTGVTGYDLLGKPKKTRYAVCTACGEAGERDEFATVRMAVPYGKSERAARWTICPMCTAEAHRGNGHAALTARIIERNLRLESERTDQ